MSPSIDYIESPLQIERPRHNRRRPKALHREARQSQLSDGILNNWGRMVIHDTVVSVVGLGSASKQFAATCKLDAAQVRSSVHARTVEALYASNIRVVIDLAEEEFESRVMHVILPRTRSIWGTANLGVETNAAADVSSIIKNVEFAASSANLSRALDRLYAYVDPFVENFEISHLNQLFKELNPDRIDLTLAIGYLTSSLPLHRKLSERKHFKKRLIDRLKRDNRDPKRLLAGL